jgi:hypothetical protein
LRHAPLFLSSLALVLLAAPAPAQRKRELARDRTEAWASDPALLRVRPARLRIRVQEEPLAIELELFDGESAVARQVSFHRTRAGGFTWYGELVSDPEGHAAFAVQGDALIGTIRKDGRLYRVRETWNRGLVVYECDPNAFPPCDVEEGAPVSSGRRQGPAGTAGPPTVIPDQHQPGGGDTVVDIAVLWTAEAEAAAGGPAAIQAVIDLALLETNQAFAQSQVDIHLRLVHSQMVAYTETGNMKTDLTRLQAQGDGYLDVAHVLREMHGADIVSLLLADDSACGRSYNMGAPASTSYAPWAFNLVSQGCATGYYAFGHEQGHTMGLDHDRPNTKNVPSHPYAYGFWTEDDFHRTIMALARDGNTGVRIQYFSNPDLTYEGMPLGVDAPDAFSSDCARALDENAGIVAAFRATVGSGQPRSSGATPLPAPRAGTPTPELRKRRR